MKTNVAITPEKGAQFKFTSIDIAEPQTNEILVKIIASGVCHTDAVSRDEALTPYPVVLGHEGSGVVEKVGPGVTSFKQGDHVILSFAHCGHCENCLTGHPTVCTTFNALNFGGHMEDGTSRLTQNDRPIANFFGQSSFSNLAIVNERNAIKVDSDVDLRLLGPLGCGIQTGAGTVLNYLKPSFGSSIAIYGSGAVGLSAVMAAKIVNCEHIIAVDIHDSRLTLAKELGATHTINSKNEDVVERIKEITKGGTHYAVETTGVPQVVRQCLQALRPLGEAAIVGITAEIKLDVHNDLMAEGKKMTGVIEGDSVPRVFIPQLIDYYKAEKFPFDRLVKFYDFNNIEEAFEDSRTGKTIKPILTIQ